MEDNPLSESRIASAIEEIKQLRESKNESDRLDEIVNEIEQGFMQRGGWKGCRYLLGKLIASKDAEIRELKDDVRLLKFRISKNSS